MKKLIILLLFLVLLGGCATQARASDQLPTPTPIPKPTAIPSDYGVELELNYFHDPNTDLCFAYSHHSDIQNKHGETLEILKTPNFTNVPCSEAVKARIYLDSLPTPTLPMYRR